MIGYFFKRSKEKSVLYIPNNLIVVEDDTGMDINYRVNNLNAFDLIWKTDKTPLLGNYFKECLIYNIEFPNQSVQKFQDYCFGNKNSDIIYAHLCAMELFKITKNEINQIKKKKIKKKCQ